MHTQTRLLVLRGVTAMGLLLATILSVLSPSAPSSALAQDSGEWSAPRTVYIPSTGQSIDGYFLDLWRENGGVSVFGNPVTPEVTRGDGVVVQYYEYARFEYWPDGDSDGDLVSLGEIGFDLRPATIARLPGAGTSAKSTEMNRIIRAWEPLSPAEIQPDSDTYRFVPETGHSIYDGFLTYWLGSGMEWYLGNPLSEEYVVGGVSYQVFERGQLRWEPGTDVTLVDIGRQLADRQQVDQRATAQGDIPTYDETLFIPPAPPRPLTLAEQAVADGADPGAERWVDVDLTNQYLRAYQGNVVVLETSVSTGTPGWETPTGTFYTGRKLPVDDMAGTVAETTWFVPDVPNVQYFTNEGHALHGTYWHSNFGTPMSHGCINLPLDVAALLYDWAPLGMRLEIHY